MNLQAVLSETWRNLYTGMSRAGLWGLSLLTVLGLLVQLEVSSVAGIVQRTRDYVAQGGSTFMLLGSDLISAKRCDALAGSGQIAAAGALRQTTQLTLPAMPDLPIAVYEASEGWWHDFGPKSGHVALSEPLARLAAPQLMAGQAANLGELAADSFFAWPEDGRVSSVGLAIVTRGLRGPADECWARTLDPAATNPPLLRWVLTGEGETSTTKLNPTLGALTSYEDFQHRPSRFAWLAAVVFAGALAGLAWRRRAIELALARSIGVPRLAVLLGACLEALVWSGAAGLGALAWGVIQAQADPDLVALAAPVAFGGTAGAVTATLLVVPLLIRRDVDHYQRHAAS